MRVIMRVFIRKPRGQDKERETKIESGFLQTKHALFEHATGSGKTGLGLVCAGHMLEDVDFVVIVVQRLVSQTNGETGV